MKKIYQFIIIGLGLFLITCNKEDLIKADLSAYTSVYIKQAAENPKSVVLFISSDEQNIPFNACLGGLTANKKDIKIDFEIKPELVAAFNAKNGTNYQALDVQSYQLKESQAVITSDNLNSQQLNVSLHTKGFMNPGESYLLPVSIKSVNADIRVNDSLRTAYFLVKGSYPIGEEPPTQAFNLAGRSIIALFTFNNFLTMTETNGRLNSYPYDAATNKFGSATVSDGGWDIFNTILPFKSSYIARWGDGRLQKYPVNDNAGITAGAEIGTDFQQFDIITSSLYYNSLFCRKPDGELLCYPYTTTFGPITSMGSGWKNYTKILAYGDGFLAVETSGELYFFPVDASKNVGTKVLVGTGWNKFSRIISFGTDLLALDAEGILWQYKFDIRGVWKI